MGVLSFCSQPPEGRELLVFFFFLFFKLMFNSAGSESSMKVLLSRCRWFLLIQKSRTLEITNWSAASKLPWWGWRRSRQTPTMKTETRRRGVWTGRTDKQVDRPEKLLDSWFLRSSGLTAHVAARFLPEILWTFKWRAQRVASNFSVMLSDTASLSKTGQSVCAIVQINVCQLSGMFICRNSHCASMMPSSRHVWRMAAVHQGSSFKCISFLFPVLSCVVWAF